MVLHAICEMVFVEFALRVNVSLWAVMVCLVPQYKRTIVEFAAVTAPIVILLLEN